MSQLGPNPLDIACIYEAELLMDVKATVVDPEVVPTVLGQLRLARSKDHVAGVMVRQNHPPTRHVPFHQPYEVAMHLALNFVQYRDACSPAVHTKRPSDFLGELSAEVPAPPANLCFIYFDWPMQL